MGFSLGGPHQRANCGSKSKRAAAASKRRYLHVPLEGVLVCVPAGLAASVSLEIDTQLDSHLGREVVEVAAKGEVLLVLFARIQSCQSCKPSSAVCAVVAAAGHDCIMGGATAVCTALGVRIS